MKVDRRRAQRGYMIEIPILVVAVVWILSFVVPKLPPTGAKIALILGALLLSAGAYYMLIIPGWQPNARRLRPPWNWVVFLPIAGFLLLAAVAYAVKG
jgi:hypothetical protein